MRKALIVGIDFYHHIAHLHGCVNDAHAMKAVLDRHSDGSVNFGTKMLVATDGATAQDRTDIKSAAKELFAGDPEIALFYFAGHGHIEATGGYLCGSDCKNGDDGLSLIELVSLANASKAKNKVIILDSCHSGVVGIAAAAQVAELSEGMTILTASTAEQYATEQNGSGVFTSLLVDALAGAAGNLVGDVTPGSVYAHVDQSLGVWEQRPVFRTNVKSFVSLRKVQPPITLPELQRLTEFFPPGFSEFKLDPSFEPERNGENVPVPDPAKVEKFRILQKYNRVNLVLPVDAPHMWHAAMQSKSCKLTVLGEHYRRLVAKGSI